MDVGRRRGENNRRSRRSALGPFHRARVRFRFGSLGGVFSPCLRGRIIGRPVVRRGGNSSELFELGGSIRRHGDGGPDTHRSRFGGARRIVAHVNVVYALAYGTPILFENAAGLRENDVIIRSVTGRDANIVYLHSRTVSGDARTVALRHARIVVPPHRSGRTRRGRLIFIRATPDAYFRIYARARDL